MTEQGHEAKTLANLAAKWDGIGGAAETWLATTSARVWIVTLPLGAAVELDEMTGWTVTAATTWPQVEALNAWELAGIGIN